MAIAHDDQGQRLIVVCGYTPAGLRPQTAAALKRLGCDVEMVDVSGRDDAYAGLLGELWAAGEDVLLIEHDMVPTAAMVAGMRACPSCWCANGYPANRWGHIILTGLGFTRFRGDLLRAEPDAVDRAACFWSDRYPHRHWGYFDTRLALVLTRRHYAPHRHFPNVEHLHDYSGDPEV